MPAPMLAGIASSATWSEQVRCRPLLAADRRLAGTHMAAAFFHDPAIQHLLPEATKRAARLAWLMRAFLRLGERHGMALVAGNHVTGSAVCLPSEDASPTPGRLLRSGWAWAPMALGWRACLRLLALMREVEQQRQRLMPGRHYYLLNLSVRPACQGQGIGSALLRAVLERAAQHRVPCYLETFNASNLPFYRRHGFELLSQACVASAHLPFWCMAR